MNKCLFWAVYIPKWNNITPDYSWRYNCTSNLPGLWKHACFSFFFFSITQKFIFPFTFLQHYSGVIVLHLKHKHRHIFLSVHLRGLYTSSFALMPASWNSPTVHSTSHVPTVGGLISTVPNTPAFQNASKPQAFLFFKKRAILICIFFCDSRRMHVCMYVLGLPGKRL